MPKGVYSRSKGRNDDMKGIAKLLQESGDIDGFYTKMREVYKTKYSLTQVSHFWREKSRIIPKHLIETKTIPAYKDNSSFKDAEAYLSEILNEIRITNCILQEQLILFKQLKEKNKEELK